MLFVQTGMNGIDALRLVPFRSDAKRRKSTAVRKKLSETGTATEAILAYTAAGPTAIAIVGTAFGFATATFTNVTSRLLLQVDQSTVQTVVLTRQNQFRQDLPRLIDNRAAAIYALRSYLRLCMPMTIETQINTTVKLFERGGVPAMREAQANPMIDAQTVRTATITTVARPSVIRDVNAPLSRLKVTALPPSDTRIGVFESKLSQKDMKIVLDMLCLSGQSDLGPRGSSARAALSTFLAANGKTTSDVLTRAVFADIQDLRMSGKRNC